MDLTKESIISLLVAEGGKVKKSDLEAHFKSSVDCVDPAEKDRSRELFKTLVNNVAYVKAIDGTRFVILRKPYLHFLGGSQTTENGNDDRNTDVSGEQEQAPDEQDEQPDNSEELAASGGNPASLSPIELALQRSKCEEVKVRKMLNFDVNRKENDEIRAQSKPYGLPLRIPVSSRVEIQKLRVNPEEPPHSRKADASKTKRKPSSVESCSPQLRRAARNSKVTEEPKDSRISSMFPLEQTEHEWLVKCAAGQWTQVHGLLLADCHLAQKKDFISGFTVLHWAAKCGNSKMLSVVMDMVWEGKVNIDINSKSHGGYTPLHIAAQHDQEYIMAMLVGEFGANIRIRDNCGNRPCHYLHKGISKTVREMLTEPKAPTQPQATDPLSQREEQDVLPDLSRGLHSFSRLFQPTAIIHKKKPSQRSGLYSLSEDNSEEQEASDFRHRVMSNASVC
ncbi:ankyrin repeat domain-containing protein SOWAHB [Xiphophorus couchianus]|uniref:Sosondowah ankyrin repeat domain family member Aa n=1 Tax=Xiphophorus couchianus TaxID=32473 RepID=A0A3B5L7Q9_9TELE|nr:ankyrin repeat domain-containing protein SOWAHB-like [Xiphophorus couchianus]